MNEFSNFIYEAPNALDEDKCKYLIQYFEDNKHLHGDGMVGNYTVNRNIKYTTDIMFDPGTTNDPKINKIITHINQLFDIHTNIYFTKLKTLYNIDVPKFFTSTYKMQKYYTNQGFFRNHTDFNAWSPGINSARSGYRIFAYMFYLNTVDEGGTTSFFNHQSIKPEVGKLLFFPAEWFFMHGGNIPISNDKYIITGCFNISN
jgi:hypothetical protein